MTRANNKVERANKLITLPNHIWALLSVDAERCKRSVTKQVEAILSAYFELADVGISDTAVRNAQEKNYFKNGSDTHNISNEISPAAPEKTEIRKDREFNIVSKPEIMPLHEMKKQGLDKAQIKKRTS